MRAWFFVGSCILACQPNASSSQPVASSANEAAPTEASPSPSPAPSPDPVASPSPDPVASPSEAPFASAAEVVSALSTALPATVDAVALEALRGRIAATPGIAAAELRSGAPGLTIAFEPPLGARDVAAGLGWKDVFVVSGDVHQRFWHLERRTGAVDDPHNDRISAELPTIGPWRIEAQTTGRPPGPLPKQVAGASPAYPLADGIVIARIAVTPSS